MSRIVEGIKELLGKGKDDDDDLPEYRYRYDQRQSPGANRVYGNYPTNGTSEVRSGYRKPFGEALDDTYVRNGYIDTRASPRGAEYRKPYGVSEYTSPRGSEYGTPRGIEYASPRGTEYASPRGTEYATPRGTEYASSRGAGYAPSPRGTEYQRPYVGSEVASPRGEYVRAPLESPRDYMRSSPRGSRRDSNDSVIEFMVPMCCDKCKEKVKEELSEVEGVESVRCDPPNSRVIVTGDDSIDVERCLKKAERAVKKKCELISSDAGPGTGTTRDSASYYSAMDTRAGTRDGTRVTLMSPSGGRPGLVRMPSFASGKVTEYDGVGPRGQDYEAKDYNGSGFRRMPSFDKYRNHEAEYISSYDRRPDPMVIDSQRRPSQSYAPRRMPSFNRHRNNDAEYITSGDLEYSTPRTFYDSNPGGSTYSSAYNERPVIRSQVSFSKLPVENPNYMKHVL